MANWKTKPVARFVSESVCCSKAALQNDLVPLSRSSLVASPPGCRWQQSSGSNPHWRQLLEDRVPWIGCHSRPVMAATVKAKRAKLEEQQEQRRKERRQSERQQPKRRCASSQSPPPTKTAMALLPPSAAALPPKSGIQASSTWDALCVQRRQRAEAATIIQACLRGWLTRRWLAQECWVQGWLQQQALKMAELFFWRWRRAAVARQRLRRRAQDEPMAIVRSMSRIPVAAVRAESGPGGLAAMWWRTRCMAAMLACWAMAAAAAE